MWLSPPRAITRNQKRGERPEDDRHARRAVALDREQADQDGEAEGQDVRPKAGVASFSPSTAESTEIAGVMIASPYEQGNTDHAKSDHSAARPAERPLRQGHEGGRAALGHRCRPA